jgi:hypothetical protein
MNVVMTIKSGFAVDFNMMKQSDTNTDLMKKRPTHHRCTQ